MEFRRRILPSAFLALCALLAAPAARAQENARALTAPDADAARALIIESRLTGRHLEAFVDGYVQPGMPRPDAGGLSSRTPPQGLIASPWSAVPPPALWVHSTIYDPIRDRLIVFGGEGYSGSTNDVWAFYLSGIPHWAHLSPSGPSPSARAFHTAIYDSLRDRMIVFGGSDGANRNDVWVLSFAGNPTWSQLAPAGTAPLPRAWHTAVFDKARNRMIVHGGASSGTRFSDVWALSLGAVPAWSQIVPGGTSPGGRSTHCALVDADGDRMIIFAGLDQAGQATSTVWSLTLGATPMWTQLAPTGSAPSPRYGTSARYDALRRRALFFGGGLGAPNLNETWALSLAGAPAWTLVPTPNPPQGRQFHSSAYDPFGDRLLVFGGSSGPVLSDTWALPLASPGAPWIPLTSTRRRGHSSLYDPTRQRMISFGGESGTQLNDVWELGLGSAGTWARLNPAGTPPSARALHGAIYDERRDRMIVFGGRGGPPLNDLWELTFSGTLEWRPIQPLGTPPPARFDHVMVYDVARYRILVFGGINTTSAYNDAWVLNLGGTPAWSPLATSGTRPAARAGSQAIFDPLRDRLVLFGGYNQSFTALNDAWQLSLQTATPTWTALAPSGTRPAARFASATAYDPTRDRMVLVSGTDFVAFFDDAWELQFAGGGTLATWRSLADAGSGPTSRSDHKAVYDPATDRMIVFGGINQGGVLHDTWSMGFTPTVGVPGGEVADASAGATLALAGPHPARDGAHLAFTLPRPGTIALSIHDATGRRVGVVASGSFTAGRHAAAWNGRDESGRRVRPGVYFARLVAEGMAATAKVVVL